MDGFLNIVKPPGMSSHDVVAFIRRRTKAKVGHTGTLDPAAAGVLVLALGKATKFVSFVSDAKKSYRAEVTLGISTDTLDADGQVTHRQPVPSLAPEDIKRVLAAFVGAQLQRPPMFSALHHQGKRLYQLAREGIEVDRPKRPITIYTLQPVSTGADRFLFDVDCSKGTYVRVLCSDIAKALGTVGYMSFLIRTAVGPFCIESAHTLEEVTAGDEADAQKHLLPLDYPLAGLPAVHLTQRDAERVRHGNTLRIAAAELPSEVDEVRLYNDKTFIALAKARRENDEIFIQPRTVLL